MSELLLHTRYGTVGGTAEDGLVVFRGVQYGAAPTGPLRFRPTAPPEPWEGVRDATSFARLAPQPPPSGMGAIPGDPVEQSEDCLYLNVWTPAMDDARRPVMVFVHGGGFTSGASSVAIYDGASLARRGAVVVTFNYRLGILGWLAHPVLADPVLADPAPADPALAHAGGAPGGFGNWGLHDQVAALAFVRDHAELLGGDPGNVTIFGESAGAMSVGALVGSAEARPLFQRAIMESGPAAALGPPAASRVADLVAKSLGGDLTRSALEAQPVEALLSAQADVGAAYGLGNLPFQPVVDGGLLQRHPAVAVASGEASAIDLLIGTNRDEWRFFTFNAAATAEIDEARLLDLVRRQVGGAGLLEALPAEELIEVFRAGRLARGESVQPPDLYTALATDWVFRVPSMRMAAAQASHNGSTYAYLFDWESPFGGGALGSCHALELPFVFGTIDNPLVALFAGAGPDAEALSEAIQSAWVAFAATGDPAAVPGAREPWPAYSDVDRATKRLGSVRQVLLAPMEAERAHLDRGLGPYGEAEELAMSILFHGEPAASPGT
ncbi:MAG: carboxylesterase/lipase family protein [Acidimicrobiales bacterium]